MKDCRLEGQNLFALVTYTPEALRKWLLHLRQLLPVSANSEPHITILPPRPLLISMEQAKRKISGILNSWPKFEITLSGIQVFSGTNVLYLEVSEGSGPLRHLHAELNTGDFAHEEVFEFHPHVTIGGPVGQKLLETTVGKASRAWDALQCPRSFEIDEVVLVSIAANERGGDWRRKWTHKLSPTKAYARAVHTAVTNRTF